jgi:hypothetical protein
MLKLEDRLEDLSSPKSFIYLFYNTFGLGIHFLIVFALLKIVGFYVVEIAVVLI